MQGRENKETSAICFEGKIPKMMLTIMAIGVVEFSGEGYKIRKDFA